MSQDNCKKDYIWKLSILKTTHEHMPPRLCMLVQQEGEVAEIHRINRK